MQEISKPDHRSPRRFSSRWPILGLAFCAIVALTAYAADTVPTDVQIPGTQPIPTDNVPTINSVGNCGCHDFSPLAGQTPESVPVVGWQGGMMANAGRDPIFWATVAVAEQDFLPSTGGVGDLCLHCHSVKGWLEGRSTPTDGSGMDAGTDAEGIMCEFCHLVTNPDQANSIPNPPEGSYVEEQNGDFLAYDESTGDGYYGGAEYVVNSGGTRLGPYTDPGAKHDVIPSAYHRDARMCGTCHDVSNPAVGDLAHNHGALVALPGSFSGVVNGTVGDKAAMNNPPESYGIVERTFSEWVSSEIDTLRVNDFPALTDAVLKTPGGALDRAYQAARWGTCSGSGDLCNVDANCSGGETCNDITADYQLPMVTPAAAGQARYFTCQTCHMPAAGGKGAQQGRGNKFDNSDPWDRDMRPDLPAHDQTGMSYWIPKVVQWQDQQGTLRFGTGLTSGQISAMDAAMLRAEAHIKSAAHLAAAQNGNQLEVTVTNLTGHKLLSGYPEGRRMWINVKWYDGGDVLIHEDGAYGELSHEGSPVTVQDNDGTTFTVRSILDPDSTEVFEAEPGMTQEWAAALISLGYPGDMVLEWDREEHTPEHTLQELADSDPGTIFHTFHFVLNNAVYNDNRIPPYRMSFDEAERRNALPVPTSQYGDPGPGGAYDHFAVVPFAIPANAVRAEARLYYQHTSWEYIQFLWKQPTSDPLPASTFLANEGVNMMDAWLNARWDDNDPNSTMSPPVEMASATATVSAVLGVPGEASHQDLPPDLMLADYNGGTGEIDLTYTPACDATDHTIYWGDLADVGSYLYGGAECFAGTSGTASFDPGGGSFFFVIVGNNGVEEGSYGLYNDAGTTDQRDEDVGTPVCDLPRNLAGVTCE
jgi:hypothetical protein